MGGSYKRCPECGGRALSIATRCPRCESEFPAAEAAGGGGPGRPISLSLPVVLLAGIVVVVMSQVGRAAFPREQRSSLGAAVTASEPVEVGAADSGSGTSMAPAPAETPPASGLLVAHGMIYLRSGRSRSAPLEAVLERGDTLRVDSLAGGWYRVTFEEAVMGYAERSGLDTLGTPIGPLR